MAVTLASLLLLGACGGSGGSQEPASTGSQPAGSDQQAAGSQPVSGDPDRGAELYKQGCVACHGADARGITGVGKDLVDSEFIASSSEDDLVSFLLVGRTPDDPANTTGLAMPPKGGNPALNEDDLRDIAAYLKQLQAGGR